MDETAEAQFDALTDKEEELKKKVDEFREGVQEKARVIIHDTMPTKILSLNETLKDFQGRFELDALDHANSAATTDQTKKRKLEPSAGGKEEIVYPQHVPLQKRIVELEAKLKEEVLDLIEMSNTVKISIQLNIPRIEDGNNFGVSIQEETVNELSRAEDSGFVILENMYKYHVSRAKLVTKIVKYPNVEDYRQSVADLDHKTFFDLRMCAVDLRNSHALLHDLIYKNLDRLKKPRSSNGLSMY